MLQMCVGQRCVSVDKIRGEGCPQDCNHNGVCNSKGHCHCLVGFAPPYCDLPGPGGSVDSGPASDPDVKYQVLRATFYLVLMVVVPLAMLGALALCIFHRREVVWWVSRKSEKHKENSSYSKPESKNSVKRKKSQESVHSLPSKKPLSRGSFRNVEISEPVLQNSTKNIATLPPRTSPERTLSWTPGSMRTRAPINRRTGRPISIPSSRPACPPPKPPSPKVIVAVKPPTSFYDDCHNYLDFSDTPLAFIHNNSDEKQPLAPSSGLGGKIVPKSPSSSNNINRPYSNLPSSFTEHTYNIVESPKKPHSSSPSLNQNNKPISTIYQNTMNNLESSNFSKNFSKEINIPSSSSSSANANTQSASTSNSCIHKLNPQTSTFTGSSKVVPTIVPSGETKSHNFPLPHSNSGVTATRPPLAMPTFSPLSTSSLATFIPITPKADGPPGKAVPEGNKPVQSRAMNSIKARGIIRSNSGAGTRGPATIHRPYSSGSGLQAVPVAPPSLSSLPGYKPPAGRTSPRRSPAASKLVLTAIPAADPTAKSTRVASLATRFDTKPPIYPSKPKPM